MFDDTKGTLQYNLSLLNHPKKVFRSNFKFLNSKTVNCNLINMFKYCKALRDCCDKCFVSD